MYNPMNNLIQLKGICLVGLLLAGQPLFAKPAQSPEQWPYWPAYDKTPLNDIQPQQWRTKEDVIDGWDWSMPPEVKPSEHSLMGVERLFYPRKMDAEIHPQFPVNAVVLHWITWREIEPEEGVYRWDKVREWIEDTQSHGCEAVLRILTSAKAMQGKGKTGEHDPEKGSAPRWMEHYNIPTSVSKKIR
jgi:hypothetical protein